MTNEERDEFDMAAARWGDAWDAAQTEEQRIDMRRKFHELHEVVDRIAEERARPARELLRDLNAEQFTIGGSLGYQLRVNDKMAERIKTEVAKLQPSRIFVTEEKTFGTRVKS